ncbi:L-serine ammonia-lyase, iron-sulfur-dependent, subunit alpha [Mycobacterium sp. 141]|uniref:L-serine ammonia-lyase, iron-sulfur-dependent, subunit alpha n=1 Tax=Mycobacterium sp. 141 TaxID=1120797 RepID=UPI0003606968|nr:L-serine ammonia-lyase, iron-sulfur-dependent, subunit alpha [Mycobacterium sp. 141]
MQDLSLLNSVIGPVMRGPSSSHSAAPYFIATTIRQLAAGPGERLERARVVFDPSGSFAAVYAQQGSDEGFAAGFLGVGLHDPDYRAALGNCGPGSTIEVVFDIEPLEDNDHPNRTVIETRVRQTDGAVRTDRFRAVSTGGGMFVVDCVNRAPINITGADRVVIDDGGRVRIAEPVQLPVVSTETLITSAATLISPGTDLAELALELEGRRLGLPAAQVRQYFADRLAVMLASVHAGLLADPDDDGMAFLGPSAGRVSGASLPANLSPSFLHNAMSAALAVMEQNSNRGIVVAAPTAGSAGVVPGTLYALARAGVGRSVLVDSLQVMALVGGVFAAQGTFAAEMGGCSVETGASAAMAAGGICRAMGGDADQSFQAAAMCLMNTLGLVCDPVGGAVEIPCHARNIAGVSHAYSAAMAILAGFDAVLPFDGLVQATVDVGRRMHPDLRCTGRAGCATAYPVGASKSVPLPSPSVRALLG